MPSGPSLVSSEYCTSMIEFQNYLADKKAKAIEISTIRELAHSSGLRKRVCNDASVANEIVAAFSSCTSSSSTKRFSCQGKTWLVGFCGGGVEISVGSNDICGCSNELTIRPCVGDKTLMRTWGGGGSGAMSTCYNLSMKLRIDVFLQGIQIAI